MSIAPALSTAPEYAKVEQKTDHTTVEPSKLNEVYHIDLIAEHITSNDYKVPCLQFPDDLVSDAAPVASLLQQKVGVPVYVLADTSYSPCCVDEIAAQHVSGDVVFHIGSACLNPTKQMPAVYVRRHELSQNVDRLREILSSKSGKVVLYPEVDYADLAISLSQEYENIVVAIPSSSSAAFIPPIEDPSEGTTSTSDLPNRKLSKSVENLSDCTFIYLTQQPSESLLLHWSTIFNEIEVVNIHGEYINAAPALRRRYRYVQNIKASGTIGILVNTLSHRDTAALLERTKQAITRAEKKYYIFVVGKPNVAKLGNFEVIDVWVVLGCPQGGTIIDDTEYTKPIVTPYELELAFKDDWNGKWLLDFNQVLASGNEDEDADETSANPGNGDGNGNGGVNEPLFDLVTGKFVFGNTPLRKVSDLNINDKEVQISSGELTIRNTVSTAAQKLQQKSWTGLGSDHADISGEYAELKKGRSGIARNYNESI